MLRAVPVALALALALLAIAPPVGAQMLPCDDCAHLCVWAHQIESATKLQALYSDIDVAFETDTISELDQATSLAMVAWNSRKDAESPCYKELLEEFTVNPGMPEAPSVQAETDPGPSGKILRTDPFNCKVEDPSNYKARLCPQLYDALQDHEAVHQKICQALHDKAKGLSAAKLHDLITRKYSDPSFVAQQEAEAYAEQIKSMKKKMSAVLDSGCNVRKKSIKDFIGKAGAKPNIPNIYEALRLINQHNASHAPKPKILKIGSPR